MTIQKLEWPLFWAGLGYGALCLISVNFTARPGNFAIFWPANGFFLGWMLCQPAPSKIRWVIVPAIFSFGSNLMLGTPLIASIGFAIANGLELVTALLLVGRLKKSTDFIKSLEGIVEFYGVVCFGASIVGALIGSTTLFFVFHGRYLPSFFTWLLVDTAGMVITTPAVITYFKSEYAWERSIRNRIEFMGCTALGVLILVVAFMETETALFSLPRPSPYLIIPVLVWSGVRFGMRGVTVHLLGVYAFATWCAVKGFGPINIGGSMNIRGLVSLHLFPLAAAVSSFAPAILLESQRAIAARLKHRDSRYGGLWNSKLIGIYITDLKGIIREANDTFLALIEKSREELESGKIEILKLATPEYIASAGKNQEKFLAQRQIGPFERDWILEDGRRIASLVYASLMDEPDRALGMVIDMEELHLTKSELRTVESRFRTMFDSNVLAAAIVDKHRMVVEANNAFLLLTGYSVEDLKHRIPVDHLIVPGNEAAHKTADAASLKFGKLEPHEIIWQRKDGSQVPIFRGFSSLPDDAGFLVVAMDLSAQKRTQAELESANEAKSQFLAHMSHEIRTPLNGVLGMLSILQGSGLSDSQEAHVQIGQESGKYLLAIINQVLDYSKLGSDQFELAHDEFILRSVVSGSLAPLVEQAKSKHIEIHYEIGSDIPESFVGDPVQLQQVLINLLGNAVKFSSSGRVTLKLILEEIIEDICRIRFEVEDQGPGIASSLFSGLFLPFKQGDATLSRRSGGTGLGLAISKEIVQRMGGKIWLESTVGKGSCFYFTAELLMSLTEPSLSNEGNGFEGRITSGRAPLGWCKAPAVLVVDDHPVNLIVAASMLKRLGCIVDTVSEGTSALRSVAMKAYDLVFMDCQMPDMDGFETTRKIRATETGEVRLPIVALTAHAVDGVREKCISEGMDDYIAKPFTDLEIEFVLRRWNGHLLIAGEKVTVPESLPMPQINANIYQPVINLDPGSSVIEWKRLSKLDDGTDAGRETVLELLQLFLDSSQSIFIKIREHFENESQDELNKALHKLKGSCGTMGAIALHQSIRRLEVLQLRNARSEFGIEMETLNKLFQLTFEEFRRKYPTVSTQVF